jgi:hypothetical protein
MICFGIEAAGWECRTSFCDQVRRGVRLRRNWKSDTDPACVGIQKSPEHAIFANLLHAPTAIQENRKHPLPKLDDADVFLCLRRLRGVVGHGMLLGYRRYNQRWVEVDERLPQGGELGVPSSDLEILTNAISPNTWPGRRMLLTPVLMVYAI